MKTTLWGHKPRGTGYEIRAYVVMDDGKIFDEVLWFEKEPSKEEIAIAQAKLEAKLLEMVSMPEEKPERIWTNAEVKNFLLNKGLLKTTENVEDLKSLDELLNQKEIIK